MNLVASTLPSLWLSSLGRETVRDVNISVAAPSAQADSQTHCVAAWCSQLGKLRHSRAVKWPAQGLTIIGA